MSTEATIVFTTKTIETILNEGGTSSWRLDPRKARTRPYAVCTRNNGNSFPEWEHGPEPHGSAFVVGKVRDVVRSNDPNYPDRYLIRFTKYARIDVSKAWKGDRNPVRVGTLDDLGLDPEPLDWHPMPASKKNEQTTAIAAKQDTAASRLTIAEAKQGLALTFGVAEEKIEITIRG